MDNARLLLRGVLFSGGLSPRWALQRDSGFYSEFLGPLRVGASANQGAFFRKASTKAAALVLAVRPRRIRYLSDLPFHKCRGEIRWIAR
jgi:hypothetical protein